MSCHLYFCVGDHLSQFYFLNFCLLLSLCSSVLPLLNWRVPLRSFYFCRINILQASFEHLFPLSVYFVVTFLSTHSRVLFSCFARCHSICFWLSFFFYLSWLWGFILAGWHFCLFPQRFFTFFWLPPFFSCVFLTFVASVLFPRRVPLACKLLTCSCVFVAEELLKVWYAFFYYKLVYYYRLR